ncbi:antiviral innate immune response receptor RIG-I-like [Littorina saxatilis]|uniref:antiviral innate immune response receptor RIG-I-like n=1 Tax=Littorina saxatilis TaxID=31220 RepID=UPI0038B68FF4
MIRNHLEQERPGVRRAVFLVNNRALAEQQYRQYFVKYLSNFRITLVVGGDGATASLNQLLNSADIFVMTAQILLNALEQKEIDGIHEFSLVVFDECHHTQLKHTYNRIMHHYMALKFQGKDGSADVRVPRLPVQVVGLTASVGVGNARTPTEAEEHVMKLCAHLDTEHISTVQENLEQLHSRTNKPVHQRAECGTRPNDKFHTMIREIMTKIEESIEHSEYVDSDVTGGLQARMRQKPHQRGSCQYTNWISELLRTVTLLPDGQACRALKPCCDMLKIYNDSLLINDECDTEDALNFLDQQMSDYDPTGQRNTQTDRFLKDLFQTNKSNLTVVSKEQADTNPKLNVIEDKLIKTFEETADSRAVLLVQTREQADIMLRWLRRRPWLHRLNVKPEKMVGACASADKGGMTDTQQKDVLDNFREGRYNVLVATSIAEEGLHFPSCNLVTLVNHVTNEIAYMQARGRARAENSEFFIVAGENKGVQQKAKDLDIGEMMMHEAVRQVQALGKQNHVQFLEQLYQIQEKEKKERDAELTLRQNRHLEQGEVEFHCVLCNEFAFRSSDVRRIDNNHYVVIDLDYCRRHTERMHPPQLLGRIQNVGRLYCNGCEEYRGPILVYRKLKFPCVKLEGFRYTNASGEKNVAKKWGKTKLVVKEMTDNELDQYRKKAVEIGYVFKS